MYCTLETVLDTAQPWDLQQSGGVHSLDPGNNSLLAPSPISINLLNLQKYMFVHTGSPVGGGIHKISCVPEQIPMGGYKECRFAKRLELIW